VVVVDGGEVGVETGMHLAEKGHKVVLLEMLDMLAPDAPPIHFYDILRETWEKLENFKYVLKARCNGIRMDKVTYINSDGKEQVMVPEGYCCVALLPLGYANEQPEVKPRKEIHEIVFWENFGFK
jgi:pyruvate/2-oxoglutarate dehydrogenase complex dihydrolipoamide dehydrogenase (E3) component